MSVCYVIIWCNDIIFISMRLKCGYVLFSIVFVYNNINGVVIGILVIIKCIWDMRLKVVISG